MKHIIKFFKDFKSCFPGIEKVKDNLIPHDGHLLFITTLGYHVWSEISESRRPGCPPEFMHIEVPKEDPVFGSNSSQPVLLQFQRAEWDPSTGKSPNNPRTQVHM